MHAGLHRLQPYRNNSVLNGKSREKRTMENRGGGASILTSEVNEHQHQDTLSPASNDESLNDTIEQHLDISLEKKEMQPSSTTAHTHSSLLDVPSTIALCLCTLTHSYLLISVFPYSGYMAIDLLSSVNEENAGSYAGWIASSFMLGRAISSYAWGKAADVLWEKDSLAHFPPLVVSS